MSSDSDESYYWIIGVIMMVIGSIGANLGNNLVSLGHKESNLNKVHPDNHISGTTPPTDPDSDDVVKSLRTAEQSFQPNGENNPSLLNKGEVIVKTSRFGLSSRTIGTITCVVGNLLTFAAFGFAAQSLLGK